MLKKKIHGRPCPITFNKIEPVRFDLLLRCLEREPFLIGRMGVLSPQGISDLIARCRLAIRIKQYKRQCSYQSKVHDPPASCPELMNISTRSCCQRPSLHQGIMDVCGVFAEEEARGLVQERLRAC